MNYEPHITQQDIATFEGTYSGLDADSLMRNLTHIENTWDDYIEIGQAEVEWRTAEYNVIEEELIKQGNRV